MKIHPPAFFVPARARRSRCTETTTAGPGRAAFVTDLVRGDRIMAELERQAGEGAIGTPFQTAEWLAILLRVVAPKSATSPLLAVVRERDGGRLVLSLPLLVYRRRGLTIAEATDLGLSDYCAPLLGPAMPTDPARRQAAAEALFAALAGIDLLRLRKMPADIEGIANPFAADDGVSASKFNGNRLIVETSLEAFLAGRGKKYRKEAERSWRRLEERGEVRVARATLPNEIARGYAALEAWQSERHRAAGHHYWLDLPEVSAFYRDLVMRNIGSQFASLYTLEAGGTLAAVVLGVTHRGGFTLLRIADGGEAWRHCSPGRMVVLGVMRELVASGVRCFDMGIGDYPFKRWIGCIPYPLYDLDVALSWRGRPAVALARLEKSIRASPRALALARRISRRLPGRSAARGRAAAQAAAQAAEPD